MTETPTPTPTPTGEPRPKGKGGRSTGPKAKDVKSPEMNAEMKAETKAEMKAETKTEATAINAAPAPGSGPGSGPDSGPDSGMAVVEPKPAATPEAKIGVKSELKDPRPVERARARLVPGSEGLVVTRIGKSFRQRPVVRGVSLKLRRGEVVGLLGPNGAGKTTCFYMMTGLIPVDYGTIELDGVDVTHLPMFRRARLGIGYLPQEASIFRGLSVAENVRAVVELHEKNPARRDQIVSDLLAEFSITHLARTPAVALSGGERRRVEIARALASSPAFILLDEPFAGIDPIAIGDIRALVSQLKARGIGVLITDHNVRETLEIIDRAYIMHDGLVIKEGSAADIVRDKDVRRLFLGERFSL